MTITSTSLHEPHEQVSSLACTSNSRASTVTMTRTWRCIRRQAASPQRTHLDDVHLAGVTGVAYTDGLPAWRSLATWTKQIQAILLQHTETHIKLVDVIGNLGAKIKL